ncbi:MAG: bacteriohemerythrin [Rhodospirillaceae bacterium]
MLLGIGLIDEQHQSLVALFNALIDRLNDGFSDSERQVLVNRLFEYTQYHFTAEEQIMDSCKYAKRHSHKKQHDAFVMNIKDFANGKAMSPQGVMEIAQFLSVWIQQHILIADKEMGAFVSGPPASVVPEAGLAAEVDRYLRDDGAPDKEMSARREIERHRLWLTGKSSRRAELEFRDMSELTLDAVDLSSAALTGVNLAKASLRGANLANAVLVGADLEKADLSDANLTGADLRGANLHRAQLTAAILRGADLCSRGARENSIPGMPDVGSVPTVLVEARLEKAVLSNAKLAGCDFTGADLADADLAGADLSGSVMIGADLGGVRFDGANLNGAVIDLAMLDDASVKAIAAVGSVVGPSHADLTLSDFVAAIKEHELWIESAGAEGRRLDLDRVSIPTVKMTGRRLAGCRMRRCRVAGGEWPGTDLSMADLSYSDLRGLNLERCVLRGTSLRHANLAGADLASAILDALPLAGGGRTWPTNLEGANLSGADLSKASLVGVILRRADLTGCLVEGIIVRETDFDGAKR